MNIHLYLPSEQTYDSILRLATPMLWNISMRIYRDHMRFSRRIDGMIEISLMETYI